MKNHIIFFLFSTLIYLILLVSCNGDCGGPFPNRYKVADMELKNLKRISPSFPQDYTFDSLTPEEILNENEFFIKLTLTHEDYFAFTELSKFSLISNAHACDPALPVSDEKVVSLTVKSNKDFDSQHSSGTDLTNLFDVVSRNSGYYSRISLIDFIATKPDTKETLYLVLNTPPANQDSFTFEVTYQTSLNGVAKNLIKETKEVILAPSN